MNDIKLPGLKLRRFLEEIALTYPKLAGDTFRPPVPQIPHLDSETEEEGDDDFGVDPN